MAFSQSHRLTVNIFYSTDFNSPRILWFMPLQAALTLRKIPRLSVTHHFYAEKHNNYSVSIVNFTGL